MERRKAITAAAATSLTLLAGAAGIALNSGIMRTGGDDNVGLLSPTGIPGQPVTFYVADPTAALTPVPGVQPTVGAPNATSSASGYADEDRESDHDDDPDDYEGADDDD